MTDDVRISKMLSLWLRHKPDAAGLTLDAQGWTDVDAVLGALAQAGTGCDWQRLLRIVEESDKQRFELSADAARIRARQGHSVQVELDWPETAPPEYLYHGTVESALPAVLTDGLKPMRRHHVHLSPDIETARRVGARRGAPVILTIRAAALHATGQSFLLTSNQVWLTARVPPDHIETPAG
ncbi:RNA 2'-phosphotransferase [Sphingomonas colocasiae]|uniref:Probable RNA 2'-phosphotransferase n=1 Tax=Sphingomonas colocasiae TaxID=1848973 RepID=A0ABS7PYB9_9SPHN|nr:RNA 2'-phosphotransferase [Sphingomonas colocasiae]MBY8826296.1 RNA 2'-phosphotransferase [Sphingomonas colocasiae]